MIVFLPEFPSDNWHISGNKSFQSDFKILMEFCSNLIVIKIAFGSFSISVLNVKFHFGKCVYYRKRFFRRNLIFEGKSLTLQAKWANNKSCYMYKLFKQWSIHTMYLKLYKMCILDGCKNVTRSSAITWLSETDYFFNARIYETILLINFKNQRLVQVNTFCTSVQPNP